MKIRKILKVSGIILGVLLGILIALPFVFKNKLIQIAKNQINEQLFASVDFQEADLRFIRTFPDFTLVFKELTVDGQDEFEGKRLANIGTLQLTLDIMTVFRGETIQIKEILADQADFRFYVLPSGSANWDILKSEETLDTMQIEEAYDLAVLEFYQITNGSISYEDYTMEAFIDAQGVDHTGSGDFATDLFVLNTQTSIDTLNLQYGNIRYLVDANATAKVDLEMNLEESIYTFRDNEIKVNELYVDCDGFISMPGDDILMDLAFASNRTDFKTLLSFIPSIYKKDFESIQTSGSLALEGFINGTYSAERKLMPGFQISLDVDNGKMKYPDLNKSLEKVSFNLSVTSEGLREYDDMVIQMTNGYMEIAGYPIAGQFLLKTPFSDPDILTDVKGSLDLDIIKELVPLEEGTYYTGKVSADIGLDGKLSAIKQKKFNAFKASGNFNLANIEYRSSDLPYEVIIPKMSFDISPQFLKLNESNIYLGGSDLKVEGYIDNYLEYLFGDDVIRGSFSVTSKRFNMNELMSISTTESNEDTLTKMAVIELPGNVDFALKVGADEVIYEDLNISNVKGNIYLKEKTAGIEDLHMSLLGGTVKMNGSYNVQDVSKPMVELDFDIIDMDINEAARRFNTIAVLAPIAERTTGRFSTSMTFNSLLDQTMSPDLSSILGQGIVKAADIFIEGFEPLNEMAKRLNISRLAKQQIEDLLVYFKIDDGKVSVNPYEVALGNSLATIAGYTTLEQELYYIVNLKIPRTEFGSQANKVLNELLAQIQKKGINTDQLDFLFADVIVEGTLKSPRVSIKLSEENSDIAKSIKDQFKEVLKDKVEEGKQLVDDKVKEVEEEIGEKVEDAKEKAQAQLNARADELLKEAERQANLIRTEAKNAADRLREEADSQASKIEDEATNPLRKAAAKVAADKIRKEGNRNADKLEKEAEERISKILDEAKLQADRIRSGEN